VQEEGKKVVNKLKELEDKRHGAVIDLTPHQCGTQAANSSADISVFQSSATRG
jgi:hypothetical protein